MTVLRGFDVSSYQGAEPWSTFVSKYGISYAFTKATEGTTFIDPRFASNWEAMASAVLVRGAYHFAHTSDDVLRSARVFYDTVRPTLPTDLLMLDLEVAELDATGTRAWAIAWAKEIARLSGGRYVPGIYNGGYMELSTSWGWRGPFGWWMYPNPITSYDNGTWPTSASPPNPPSPNTWGGPPDFWQFSWNWPAQPGDPHDASVFRGDLIRLRSLNDPSGVLVTDANVISIADVALSQIWSVHYGPTTVGEFLQQAAGRAADAANGVAALSAKIDTLTTAVAALQASGVVGLTDAQVQADVRAAIIALLTTGTGG